MHTYMLSIVDHNLRSNEGKVQWKTSGIVRNPLGLHGFLRGEGEASCIQWQPNMHWIVSKIKKRDITICMGCIKVPEAQVVFCGKRFQAIEVLKMHCKKDSVAGIIGDVACVDENSNVIVGDHGVAIAGDFGIAISGHFGLSQAGDYGSSSSGIGGSAKVGNHGMAEVEDFGIAMAGYNGIVVAGKDGEIQIKYWDAKASRPRTVVGYIGEDGLLPKCHYKLDSSFRFVEAKDSDF